jgi:hypothetical protein
MLNNSKHQDIKTMKEKEEDRVVEDNLRDWVPCMVRFVSP